MTLTNQFTHADFDKDVSLMLTYAGIELPLETFQSYASKFTLANTIGNKETRDERYRDEDLPKAIEHGKILSAILFCFDRNDIHFDSAPTSPLGRKIEHLNAVFKKTGLTFDLPDHYTVPTATAAKEPNAPALNLNR